METLAFVVLFAIGCLSLCVIHLQHRKLRSLTNEQLMSPILQRPGGWMGFGSGVAL
jgi:hypothetical protein